MAVLNLNKVVLCGRLTAAPELKQTTSGIATCSFTVAVNRKYQKDQTQRQADFIGCVAWRQTAEFISRYFQKGSCICVTGAIQTRSWQDQNGQKRYATEVVVEEAMFVDSKSESAQNTATSYDTPSHAHTPTVAPKFEDLNVDDDLPF